MSHLVYYELRKVLRIICKRYCCLLILLFWVPQAITGNVRCDKRNPTLLSETLTCKDIAFLKYDRKGALIAQRVLKDIQNAVTATKAGTDFYEAFSELEYLTFLEAYRNSGSWRDLNCDMVREKKSRKKKNMVEHKLIKDCNRISKYLYGTTLLGPTCTNSRRGIQSRSEGRESVRACPVELVCPQDPDTKRFFPLSKLDVIGGYNGVESLRPKCYNGNFKTDNTDPFQTHIGFVWSKTKEERSTIGCGTNGASLGFINGIQIKISQSRDSGNGINGIKFSCSDGSTQIFTEYIYENADLFEEQTCAEGKVAVGIFQFTRENVPVYGNAENDEGEKGLLDVGLYCDYLECPQYFKLKKDNGGNTYCTLNECSCPDGKAKDAECRNLINAAEAVLQGGRVETECAPEKLCKANEQKCESCNLGFKIDNDQCLKIDPSTCSFGERVLSCADAAISDDPYCLVFDTTDKTIAECYALRELTGQRCVLKNGGEACNSCNTDFKLIQNDIQGNDEIKETYCEDINECLPGGIGEETCNLLKKTCRNKLGSYSCDLECNPETSYKVNDTSIPGGLEVCECKQNYYRDSPSVVDRVMGIDKNDFCVTCVNFQGVSEEPLCSGHGQCVAPLVPFARPVCACEPNYGGTGCEIKLTKTFTCNDFLRFECVPDPALVNDLQLQPELLLGHGWRCETLESTITTFFPGDVSLDISALSFSRVRLYDDEQEEVSAETFCLLAHLHVQQLGLDDARVRLEPDQAFELSFVQWTGAQVETSVRWGAAQDAFEAAEDAGSQMTPPPVPIQLVEPDVSWWALESAGLCPFPFNTDVFRGNEEEYLFAPCAPPDPQSENEGWFFLAQAVPGEPGSTIGCFLLDASARGKDLAVVTDAQFRCTGYVRDAAGEPHSSFDCLLRSPVLVPDIPTSTTVEERGLWVKEQCL